VRVQPRIKSTLKVAACLASTAIAAVFLIHAYGSGHIINAADGADPWYLLDAVVLGVLIQVVRAQRARWLLARSKDVSLPNSYSAMVVGHGIGDLVPVAPGGPVLRSVLTERLAGIPIAFSGGAYLVEGMLDVIAPALLVPYLLLAMPLPSWTHWVLLGVAIQAAVLLAVLAVLAARSHSGSCLPSFASPRFRRLAGQIASGLRAVTAGGLKRCLQVCGLSLLLLPLAAAQVGFFLHAFGLGISPGGLILLLVVMLSSGSVPLKIPAFGTISAAAALPLVGIHGAAAGGYLLVSQLMLSSQTAMLALLVVGWWLLRGFQPSTEGGTPWPLLLGASRPALSPQPLPVENS
jgi:uncharacterized protein (TIRG00374 family)